MNVALYSRVSTSDQSVDSQTLELRSYVTTRGWTVVQEFQDVISGSKADRPGLEEMMALVGRREIEAVVCVKLDRMARSLTHFTRMVDSLARADVALICTSQGIDTSRQNACGRLQMAVLAAVAEFERELIRERTRAGLAVARAAGKALGRKSTRMDGNDDVRMKICAEWEAAGKLGGYAGLGGRLGGVSASTAMRQFKRLRGE